MSYLARHITLILLVTTLAACGSSDSDVTEVATTVTANSSPASSPFAKFNREVSKKGCELLTAAMVAAEFDVPADKLRQLKIMGCRYSWRTDTKDLDAGISIIQAHKSEANAKTWFANATKSKTADEMKAEMERVAQRMEKHEALDTDTKKSMAQGILKSVGSKAVNFGDVAGVGDEARVNAEGSVYVRVGNLTFIASAYYGAKAPPLDLQGVDLKQMAIIARKASAQWAIETAAQRKVDGAKLARAIVAGL